MSCFAPGAQFNTQVVSKLHTHTATHRHDIGVTHTPWRPAVMVHYTRGWRRWWIWRRSGGLYIQCCSTLWCGNKTNPRCSNCLWDPVELFAWAAVKHSQISLCIQRCLRKKKHFIFIFSLVSSFLKMFPQTTIWRCSIFYIEWKCHSGRIQASDFLWMKVALQTHQPIWIVVQNNCHVHNPQH